MKGCHEQITDSLRVVTMGRSQAERWITHIHHAVISLTDPGSDVPGLPPLESRTRWMVESFYDLDQQSIEGYARMTPEQAKRIAAFVRKMPEPVLLIHCEAGVSRSPAVAAAVAKFLFGDDQEWFDRFYPNRWVYRLTLEALRTG